MKSLEKQIEFIDKKLLPLYGIKNIIDYTTVLYVENLCKKVNLVKDVNKLLKEFRELFPVKNFNLHKTDYQIKSEEHAFLFLKKILESCCIYFESGIVKKKKYLRLIPENNTLKLYINSMQSSDIRNLDEFFLKNLISEGVTKLNYFSNKFNKNDLLNNIKKEYTEEILMFPKNILKNGNYMVDLKNYNLYNKNIKDIKLYFISNIDENGIEILSKEIIKNINNLTRSFKIVIQGNEIECPLNENILFSDLFILNKLSIYSNIQLFIQSHEQKYVDNILIKCVVNYVEFYTDFQNKLNNNSLIEQIYKIKDKEYKIITTQNNIIIESNYCFKKNKREDTLIEEGIIGHEEKINNLKCYFIESSKNKKNCEASIFVLVVGLNYELVYSPYEKFLDFGNNFSIKNTRNNKKFYENYYVLPRFGDLVYGINIFTKYQLKLNNVKLYCGGLDNQCREIDYMNYPLLIEYKGLNNDMFEYYVTNINRYNMINIMSGANIGLFMHIEDEIIKNYFEDSQVNINYCYADTPIRKNLNKMEPIVNTNQIIK